MICRHPSSLKRNFPIWPPILGGHQYQNLTEPKTILMSYQRIESRMPRRCPSNSSGLGLYTPTGYHIINKTWASDRFNSLCRYTNPNITKMWDSLWSSMIASEGNYRTLVNGGKFVHQISSDFPKDSMFGFKVSGRDIWIFMLSLHGNLRGVSFLYGQ